MIQKNKNIDQKFSLPGARRLLILGSGESGMGAALLAKSKDYEVFVSDAGSISEKNIKCLIKNNILYEQNGHTLSKIIGSEKSGAKDLEFVIKSPGISDNTQIIIELKAANIPVISEIEFAVKFTNAQIIAITGSNGKTTTSLLIYHLLKSAGLKVGIAGNIGNSLSRLMMEKNHDLIVVELSSFQLDGMYEVKADTSILLNIIADHLDRYDYDINKYADTKLRIIQNQDESNLLIYNADDDLIVKKLNSKKKLVITMNISIKKEVDNGAYLSKNKLNFNYKGNYSLDIKNLPLFGKHNYYNIMSAILVALRYDVDFKIIKQALSTFKNADHRLEFVADIDGIRFINDTKATNVDSVYYALDGIDKKIIWIAGGQNKGNDYDIIRKLVQKKVKALVCLGIDNKHLIEAFKNDLEIIKETCNAKDAVEQCFAIANPGDVVLLSPACASFDLFENYEVRGNAFKKAVFKLKN